MDIKACRTKHRATITKVIEYRDQKRYGKSHVIRWQRALNAMMGDITQYSPSEIMTSEEADALASQFMRSRWQPVAEAIHDFEQARREARRATLDKDVVKQIAKTNAIRDIQKEAEDNIKAVGGQQVGFYDEDAKTKRVYADGHKAFESYLEDIRDGKTDYKKLNAEITDLKQKNADLKSYMVNLKQNIRALEQRPTLAHYQQLQQENAKLKKQLGNDEKLRLGSPEWRHEQILKQVNNLPIWSLAEAKAYYNSIGKREYSMPTHTRKGLFWMDFTTDDAGNEVQTEKPIAWFGFMGEIIDLQRKNNEKDLEIQKLYNQIYDSKDGAANMKLQSEIKHLKIQLAEATEGYVDINNIPFETAVQVLARGAFPEPEAGKGLAAKRVDMRILKQYSDNLKRALLECDSAPPLFGTKLSPSAACKKWNVRITDYGQPIYPSSLIPGIKNMIEFYRQMDIATDHTIQNLQATKYAVDKIIRESEQ